MIRKITSIELLNVTTSRKESQIVEFLPKEHLVHNFLARYSGEVIYLKNIVHSGPGE